MQADDVESPFTLSPTPPPDRPKSRRKLVLFLFILLPLLAVACGWLFLRYAVVRVFYIPSEAMEPTLMGHEKGYSQTGTQYDETVHDRIIVNKFSYRSHEPTPGDIVVFTAPKEADMQHNHTVEDILVKRIVAVGGDTVEVKKDGKGVWRVYRNNQPLDEPYIKEPMMDMRMAGAEFAVNGPLKLAPGELFVMGDNRNHSNDSRYWGPLKRGRVIGKATAIISPPGRERSLP
jgi:signal peptidase I